MAKEKDTPVTESTGTESTSTDLTTLGNIVGTMERPKSLDKNDRSGTEDIGPGDIRLPRLCIAQGLSPQVTPGDGQFIEGLTLFDMFNDVTGEVYGKGPLTFVPVRRDVRRIEFRPRNEGGGMVDPNVPLGDPRLEWSYSSPNAMKADVPPAATTFTEFIILLLSAGQGTEPIVLSIKDTNKHNRRGANNLTTFIGLRQAAIYSGLYTVDTKVPAKNDKGTFGVPNIKNAGFIPVDTAPGAALQAFAKDFHESLKGIEVVVDREGAEETDFDTATYDANKQAEAGM